MSSTSPRLRVLITGFLSLSLAAAACAPSTAEPQVRLPARPPVLVLAGTDPLVPGEAGADQLSDLAALRARLPYTIKLPGWVPEGYALADEISLAEDSAWVFLEWRHATGAVVDLIISPYAPATPNAPPQFVQTVDVAGHTGQFIFGLHNATAEQWDPTLQTLLTWQDEALYYSLAAAGTDPSALELQRMAESLS